MQSKKRRLFEGINVFFFSEAITDLKVVRPTNGNSYRTVVLTGFYSEAAYAKQALDLMTEVSLFEGNRATSQENASLVAPKNTIPATEQTLKLQVVEDGEPLPVVLNGIYGRIAINSLYELWNDPNVNFAGMNGFREPSDIVKIFLEHDAVFGDAPFTVTIGPGKKHLIFEDRQERAIKVGLDEGTLTMVGGADDITINNIRTPYGNLRVEQKFNKEILSIRLHGEEIKNFNIEDNKNGTFSVTGKTKTGTKIKLNYAGKKGEFGMTPASVSVKKRIIVPVTNIRADKNAYAKATKGETELDVIKRINDYNKEFANIVMMEMPYLNDDTVFLDTSGALTEKVKLDPFIFAGAGSALISAPAKSSAGLIPTDFTSVPGVNSDDILQVWEAMKVSSCASCTTNAAGTGIGSIIESIKVISGYFDTIHAVTRTQGKHMGELGKSLDRSVDGTHNIVWTSTGASTELAKAIETLSNIVSGVSLRVGNLDGSLVNYDLQLQQDKDGNLPTAEDINKAIKTVVETPMEQGGLKGFLGYDELKTSLEVIDTKTGGVVDPSLTKVNKSTQTLSLSIWYDNERGYTNQLIKLMLFDGLRKRELRKRIDIVAQEVVAGQDATTGKIGVTSAKNVGATGAVIGSGEFRTLEKEANEERNKPVNIDEEINKTLTQALKSGMDMPILNVFLSKSNLDRSKESDSINKQVSEAIKGLSYSDILKVVISLETDGDRNIFDARYVKAIRDSIAGYVASSYLDTAKEEIKNIKEEQGNQGVKYFMANLKKLANSKATEDHQILQDFARLLGATVSSKVRVALKFNKISFDSQADAALKRDNIIKAAKKTGIDGVILPPDLAAGIIVSPRMVSEFVSAIDKEITNSPQKREDLDRRAYSRFLVLASTGSGFASDSYLEEVQNISRNAQNIQLAIAPNAAQIRTIAAFLKGEKTTDPQTQADKVPVRVMLQNATLDYKKNGFVNLYEAVRRLGVHDILITHSEALEMLGVSDEEAAKLAKAAHELRKKGELTGNVILAVGDTAVDYEAGCSEDIVTEQIDRRLEGLTAEDIINSVIAYEPRWAIGTGRTPELHEIQAMHKAIRNKIKAKFGAEAAQKVRIIYGGSLKAKNALEILKLKDVDGGLIGGASLDAKTFRIIIAIAEGLVDNKNGDRGYDRKMFFGGNHKAYDIKESYAQFVSVLGDVDRAKIDVSIAPELTNISKLTDVYTQDPLKGIIKVDQLPDAAFAGKTFFVRVDYNMPIDDLNAIANDPDTWKITSMDRIKATLPTINYIKDRGGVVVLTTHFEPKKDNLQGPQSVEFLKSYLDELLNTNVKFVRNILGSARNNALQSAQPGDVILFENVRLDPKIRLMEKSKDPAVRSNLAQRLYAGPNVGKPTANVILVNEALGVNHRDQASVTGEVKGVPRVSGLNLARELEYLVGKIRKAKNSGKPMAIVFGGGPKITDKVPMLKNIMQNTLPSGSKIFVQGAAALPFLMANKAGFKAGKSAKMVTEDLKLQAAEILELADRLNIEIVLPVDFVVADGMPVDEDHVITTQVETSIPADKEYFDIGPRTVELFEEEVLGDSDNSRFGAILWNGPAGVAEVEQFRNGTAGVGRVIAQATAAGALTIIGGADTGYAAELVGVADKVSFISTGGGASLKLLEGVDLPGVEVLRNNAGQFSYLLNVNTIQAAEQVKALVSKFAASTVSLNSESGEVHRELLKQHIMKKEIIGKDSSVVSAINRAI